jgi:hypothetical protein
MNDPTPTPVPQSLLTTLIAAIADLSEKVAVLSEKVDQAHDARVALAKDVRCLAKGVEDFKRRFEPYLVNALDTQKEWKDRRSSLLTKMMAAGVIGALGVIGAALWHYAVDVLREMK